jgi:CTP synthase (UTP-ammonia lyase)
MFIYLFLLLFIKQHTMKVTKSVSQDMKYLRGEGRIPDVLLGAVVAFHLSGKSNRKIEALTDVSGSQVSATIKRFKTKSLWKVENQLADLKKMTRRPLQALVDSVKET